MESIIFKTLLHSLWQGLILAFLTAAVLVFANKSSARLRYNLLISCFILFSVAVFASFIYEWKFATAIAGTGKTSHAEAFENGKPWQAFALPDLGTGGHDAIARVQQPWIWMQKVWSYFNAYATTIVLLWLLVIAMKSIQLFAGLYSIKRIRHTKITDAGTYWRNRVQELVLQFGINRVVAIVQSGLVNVPMVVGYFKPLILIPIGLLNNLSKEEVEAIICHELAHVKRRDYLVNILQSFMELLFFFNPAVLWISELIRVERENCCDDLAVLNTNNKIGYISALVSCEEFQMNKIQYAMAISDHPHQLVKRVKRMVSNDSPTLTKIEQRVISVALVAVVTLSMAFSSVKQQQETTPKPIQKALEAKESKAIEKETPKTKTLTVEKEDSIFDKMASVVERGILTTEKMMSAVEWGLAETEKTRSATEKILDKNEYSLFGSGKTRTVTDRDESETKKSTITRKFVSDDESAKGYNEQTHDFILNDLIKDGLAERNEKLSFEMDQHRFVLNDKDLPEEVRKRYAKKYMKSPDWIISYKQEFESK